MGVQKSRHISKPWFACGPELCRAICTEKESESYTFEGTITDDVWLTVEQYPFEPHAPVSKHRDRHFNLGDRVRVTLSKILSGREGRKDEACPLDDDWKARLAINQPENQRPVCWRPISFWRHPWFWFWSRLKSWWRKT